MVDMRNHGESAWDAHMDYEALARDVHKYMVRSGLDSTDKKVTLVGHSLGAKTAMAFTCMFPHLVNKLVSLDASPVDRMAYPHLNQSSIEMIEQAMAVSGLMKGMPLEDAIKKIKTQVQDPVL